MPAKPRLTVIPRPVLPFPGYKWRWASVEPTESLNLPPVYLGVLRALSRCEGKAPSSQAVHKALQAVESDLGASLPPRLKLAREPKRNLLRNSRQYWSALGLMTDTPGVVRLTPLGRQVASGAVTPLEFAIATIASLELPNNRVQTDTPTWKAAKVSIRPLRLVLQVLRALAETGGEPRLSVKELVDIVIPLAPYEPAHRIAIALIKVRGGRLTTTTWPKCAPKANDKRMAKEFLLFLSHYGFLARRPNATGTGETFWLTPDAVDAVASALALPSASVERLLLTRGKDLSEALFALRKRRTYAAWDRSNQRAFRKRVFGRAGAKCILTEETLPDVLETAHIIPVEYGGSDAKSNGLCMRMDLHSLFDASMIRIESSGRVILSSSVKASVTYRALPGKIALPGDVSLTALEWRSRFM